MTAAHRTLPFNTWVRVYDLDNNRTTEVRIIDRGPFIDGRIIDLSHAAARDLEMIGPGTAHVRMVVINAPVLVARALYAVQVGTFRNQTNAERLKDQMERDFGTAKLIPRAGNPPTWRVLVGSEDTEDLANALASRIRQQSVEKFDCFVVRLDSN